MQRRSHATYVHRLIKAQDKERGVSIRALIALEDLLRHTLVTIAKGCRVLPLVSKKATLDTLGVMAATRLMLPEGLAEAAIDYAKSRQALYFSSSSSSRPDADPRTFKTNRKEERAGLTLSVARVGEDFRDIVSPPRMAFIHVFITAVVEGILSSVIMRAAMHSSTSNRTRITPRDVFLAIQEDEELRELFKDVVVPFGGVVPFMAQAKKQ